MRFSASGRHRRQGRRHDRSPATATGPSRSPSGSPLRCRRRRIWRRASAAAVLRSGGWRLTAAVRSELPGGEVVLVAPRFVTSPEPRRVPRSVTPFAPAMSCCSRLAPTSAPHDVVRAAAGAAGRVFAFEPDPAAYAGLQQHIALNAVAGRVTPVAAAVSDGRDNVLRLALGESSGISRLCVPTKQRRQRRAT